jgi:hypothetical protein
LEFYQGAGLGRKDGAIGGRETANNLSRIASRKRLLFSAILESSSLRALRLWPFTHAADTRTYRWVPLTNVEPEANPDR